MTDTTRMTGEDFDALRPRLGRMTQESMAIARAVLVDGLTRTEAAQRHGLTKQRVGAMVAAVLTAASEVPKGWERVDVWLPPDLAEHVRQLAAQAKAEATSANE